MYKKNQRSNRCRFDLSQYFIILFLTLVISILFSTIFYIPRQAIAQRTTTIGPFYSVTNPSSLLPSTNFVTYENSSGIRIKYPYSWNVSPSFISNNGVSFIPALKVKQNTNQDMLKAIMMDGLTHKKEYKILNADNTINPSFLLSKYR